MEEECAFIDEVEDWRQVYVKDITKGDFPEEKKDVAKVKRKSVRFHMFEGELYQCGFNGKHLRCIA